MTAYVLTMLPLIEPVSLAEIKAHARVAGDDEDALILSLIISARQWVEQYTGRCLIQQGWKLWLDEEPCAEYITLSKVPLLSVSAVQYFSDDDSAEEDDLAGYYVDTASEPGRLVLRNGSVWPTPMRQKNGISIDFEAGYGSTAASVPEALRLAVRQLTTHWYEHRGDSLAEGLSASIPISVYALLMPYRLRSWR